MKKAINKLIKEYERKIDTLESQLNASSGNLRSIRNNGGDTQEIQQDIFIMNAKRQAYVQAKHDIDSLLDYV